MKFTKLFAIALSVLMLLAAFTACEAEPTVEELEAAAALKLLEEPYAITTTVTYTCDDEMMAETFEALSGMEMTMYMDGTNFAMDMELAGQEVKYVYYENTLYMKAMGMKMRVELTKEQAQEMVGNGAADMSATSIKGFTEVTPVKNEDGSTTITCKGLSDEDNALVESMMAQFKETADGMDVSIDTENMTLEMVIDEEGYYESIEIDMTLKMDIEGYGEVNVGIGMEMEYDFDEGKEITLPANPESYELIDADELLG